MALDVDGLRLHITTALEDEALQGLLDAAYEAIDLHLGPGSPVDELLTVSGAGPLLMLSQAAESITAVIEDDTELEEDDYQLRSSGRMLLRLNTGTNPRTAWRRGRIDVSYELMPDDAERDRIAIALVELDINSQPGLVSQRTGDWAESYPQATGSYAEERAAILASYGQGVVLV